MDDSSVHSGGLGAAGELVDRLIAASVMSRSAGHECPYLPGLEMRAEGVSFPDLPPVLYRALMDRGFRRSGLAVYRPVCPSCAECRPIRVPVSRFRPTRSMRRVQRRNADLRVTAARPAPTEEKHALYRAYLDRQHDGAMSGDWNEFKAFLYDSPTSTVEFCYYLGRRLVGVSIADQCPDVLSSVFMVFDPEYARRSLGTFSVLWEIDYCRRAELAYYYLGYYVVGSRTMAYKARFRPNEILTDAGWTAFEDTERA